MCNVSPARTAVCSGWRAPLPGSLRPGLSPSESPRSPGPAPGATGSRATAAPHGSRSARTKPNVTSHRDDDQGASPAPSQRGSRCRGNMGTRLPHPRPNSSPEVTPAPRPAVFSAFRTDTCVCVCGWAACAQWGLSCSSRCPWTDEPGGTSHALPCLGERPRTVSPARRRAVRPASAHPPVPAEGGAVAGPYRQAPHKVNSREERRGRKSHRDVRFREVK